MDDDRRIEIDEGGETAPEDHGIEPVSEVQVDIAAVIDEAVQAVEESARRREQDEAEGGSEGEENGIEALKAELDAVRDQSLRILADFDNYRKRVERERAADRKYAVSELLREVVGIVDNLERALSADGKSQDLKVGVEMILRQMEDILERSGVTRVEAIDCLFDPSVHEAVARVVDPEAQSPIVIEEFQSGYTVHDRLLRPAIVRVAVPDSDESPGDVSEQDDGEGVAN